jgi:predicted lipid-binding transport protein (Tim44 family)
MTPHRTAHPRPARTVCRVRSALPLLTALVCALSPAVHAEFEEVRITRTEPIQVQQPCPPSVQAPAPQAPPPQPGGIGITGKEALGTAAGAVLGGVLGHQVGQGSGQTAATVGGAAVGGFAGYKLAEDKPKPSPSQQAQQAQLVCLMTQYRVFYSRPSGLQGDVMMSSMPTSPSLMINFCGDRPCN